jgi:hypothetical protein
MKGMPYRLQTAKRFIFKVPHYKTGKEVRALLDAKKAGARIAAGFAAPARARVLPGGSSAVPAALLRWRGSGSAVPSVLWTALGKCANVCRQQGLRALFYRPQLPNLYRLQRLTSRALRPETICTSIRKSSSTSPTS